MDAKLEANVDTIVSAKHGANYGITKVDVMIDEKKESKYDANEDVKRDAKSEI